MTPTQRTDRSIMFLRETPPGYQRALADDRRWFAAHPDQDVRIRPRFAGEFYPFEESCADVRLVRIERQPDGSRHRRPVLDTEGSDE